MSNEIKWAINTNGNAISSGSVGIVTKGDAATIIVGSTTTGTPGTPANVFNSGTKNDAILDFVIPKGEKGDKGLGIKDAILDDKGHFIITYDTGELKDTGLTAFVDAVNYRDESKTYSENAKTSSDIATEQATIATNQANNSYNSASNASLSANNAKTSETNSSLSEFNAKTSEDNAKLSENNAKTYEDNAKISETNAKTSETNAANSATSLSNSVTQIEANKMNIASMNNFINSLGLSVIDGELNITYTI